MIGLLVVPATLLQVGLRDGTHPWYYVNDSTYQIDLAGELVLDGETPYGHDYRGSGIGAGEPEEAVEQSGPRAPVLGLDHHARRALSGEEWSVVLLVALGHHTDHA